MKKDESIKLAEWRHSSGTDRLFAYFSKEYNDLTINATRTPNKQGEEIKLEDIKQIDISYISKKDLKKLIKKLKKLTELYESE